MIFLVPEPDKGPNGFLAGDDRDSRHTETSTQPLRDRGWTLTNPFWRVKAMTVQGQGPICPPPMFSRSAAPLLPRSLCPCPLVSRSFPHLSRPTVSLFRIPNSALRIEYGPPQDREIEPFEPRPG